MTIGLFPFFVGRSAGGPETYERNLLAALARTDPEAQYRVYCLDRAFQASSGITEPNFSFELLRPQHLRSISVPVTLPLRLARRPVDLLHALSVPPPFLRRPYVFTFHCFSHFLHPEQYSRRLGATLNFLMTRGARNADLVICVSQTVRDLVAERLGVSEDRLAVVYHGVNECFRPITKQEARDALARRLGVTGPYLLSVGRITPRKNQIRILEAYRRFLDETGSEAKLLVVGRRHWKDKSFDEAVARHRLAPLVQELGYVDDDVVPDLYAGAEMLVFPSLWEGFGLPVLEAMACGTPVLTSTESAMPEVAGGAALLANPYSVDEIAAAMCRLWSDAALREDLRAKGLARARLFRWDRAASETLALYRRVLAA